MGISIADFNDDGWQDVFIANDTEPNSLFINQSNGTFEEKGLELGVAYDDNARTGSSMGSDAKDYDNDGKVDIFYNNLIGHRSGSCCETTATLFSFHIPHEDPDAELALLRLEQRLHRLQQRRLEGHLLRQRRRGPGEREHRRSTTPCSRTSTARRFVDVSEEMGKDFLRKGYQRGSAFGDLNNDGSLDIVVTSLNESPRILMNTGDSGNHWLMLSLTGHKSARDAIGAKVKLTTASGRVLYNHVAISVGFMSSSDKRVHFGLGKDSRISSIEIRWPSGIKQVLKDVAADQVLKVDEPN